MAQIITPQLYIYMYLILLSVFSVCLILYMPAYLTIFSRALIVSSFSSSFSLWLSTSTPPYMAKASFSAYVLGIMLLKPGEKVHFSTKKSATNFGLPFCFFPFTFFASKWLKYTVFALQKAKKVGRKWGLRHIYVYAGELFLYCTTKRARNCTTSLGPIFAV